MEPLVTIASTHILKRQKILTHFSRAFSCIFNNTLSLIRNLNKLLDESISQLATIKILAK
jgi:hypothetical protein